MGIKWLFVGKSLHTTRSSIAQVFVGVVFNVSCHLYDFVADLTACRLGFFMRAAAEDQRLQGCE